MTENIGVLFLFEGLRLQSWSAITSQILFAIKLLRKINYWTNNRPPTAECIDKTSDINASFGVTFVRYKFP